MPNDTPPSERELDALESLAHQATPGPWEAQTVLDLQTGDATRAAAHHPLGTDEPVFVVEREEELAPANQRYIAALHPDATLRLLAELRRLRAVEEEMGSIRSLLRHLDEFLDQWGLTRQARRFVETRSQVEHLHPAPAPLPTTGIPLA